MGTETAGCKRVKKSDTTQYTSRATRFEHVGYNGEENDRWNEGVSVSTVDIFFLI